MTGQQDSIVGRFARLGPDPELPPAARGSYALVLRLSAPATIRVGSLGLCRFPAGDYVYCGSALGGLRARIARHLRVEKPRRWHVDYLRAVAEVVDVWVCESDERLECVLAAALAALPGASRPVAGFGSSDCRCPGHLVRLPENLDIDGQASYAGCVRLSATVGFSAAKPRAG